MFAYSNKKTKKEVITVWQNTQIPANTNQYEPVDFTIKGGNFNNPVYVDIISGKVFVIPSKQWRKDGDTYTFLKIPVYDGPVLIADKSLLSIK